MWPTSSSSSSNSPFSNMLEPTSSGPITHVSPGFLPDSLERLVQGICRIVKPDGRGTASLIGPCLLLTTHRLLPDKETARGSYAMFIDQTGRPSDESTIKIRSLPLDPDRYFQTSPDLITRVGKRMITKPVQEGRLDSTIVAIKEDPYLFSLQSAVWSLFERSSFKRGDLVSVIYVPHAIDVTTMLNGGITVSQGEIKDYDEDSLFHNCAMGTGSEGGIVVDQEGQPIALNQYKVSEWLHSAVLISKVAKELESKPLGVETLNAICLSTQDRIIGLPQTTDLFTGREEELRLLEKACLGGGKRVAIVGLGGIGKTALAVKYANDHQSDYSLIRFIRSGTKSQIEIDLIDLADELKIENGNREYRLLVLRGTLERSQSRSLLIFDGLDDEESWAYVCEQVPRRGLTTVLVSSRLRGWAVGSDFCQLPVTNLSKNDAVDFLLKAAGGLDTNREQAETLAETLCHLPLALKHAAAFIKFTREYTFGNFIQELRRKGVDLLGPDYVPKQGGLEQTILTTWNKSMDVACQGPFGALAADLLRLFSLLAEAPIPFGFMKQLKHLDRDVLVAIRHLTDCSLLEKQGDTYVLHGLLRKVISNAISESDKQYYICQELHTLYELTKDLDMEDPQTRRHLDPYIPHLEGVIASAQTIPSVHSHQVESLLDRLFFYYVGDRKSDSSKRIGEIYLKHLTQQKPDVLDAVYHQKMEIVLGHLNHKGEE